MARRDVIVIGASAGGIDAIKAVLAGVPADLDAAVLIVLHIPTTGGKALAAIFDRAGPLPATTAVEGEHLAPGRVYVAVADHHLLLVDGHVGVRRGPRENGHRPAVDTLFRSAARYHGPRVIGIVLSGTLDDGSAGAVAIKRQGGIVVVQDPEDASFRGMPDAAIVAAGADHVVAASEIGPLLAQLITEEVPDHVPPPPDDYEREVLLMETDDRAVQGAHPGTPSPWPCPDCDGVLWAV
jgi:two-component system, chemotaxis family, protein-glutamate methylesterase/glutaminase